MIGKFTDRLLRLRIKRDEKEFRIGFLITGIIIVLLFANVFYLNLIVLQNNNTTVSSKTDSEQMAENVTPTVSVEADTISQPSNSQPAYQTTQAQSVTFKDYYINLGSGTNRSTDWVDVVGTINTFDISSYKNIKEVRLETNINVPTSNGTVAVRLFNKTDNHPLWNSERTVQAEQNGSLLISENISYPHGPKLYSVQMKSQLGVEANLVQARLRIVAE